MSNEFTARVEAEDCHVALRVADLDRAVAFYHGIIGLPILRSMGPADNPRAIFVTGIQLVRVTDGGSTETKGVFDHVGLAVANIEEICARLDRAGYVAERPLSRRPVPERGNREQLMAFYPDPEGNRVELVHWV